MSNDLLRYFLETANNVRYSFFRVEGYVVTAKEGSTGIEVVYSEKQIKDLMKFVIEKAKS